MPKRYEVKQYRGYTLMWQYLDRVWDVLSPNRKYLGKAKRIDQAKKIVDNHKRSKLKYK